MKKEQIYDAIRSLARSQGFYCDLLEYVENNEEYLEELEEQNFKDVVDLVLYLET